MLQLQGRKESLHSLAFSADNQFLVTGGTAGRVDVWDLSNQSAKRPMFPKLGQTIGQVWIKGLDIVATELSNVKIARLRLDEPTLAAAGSDTGQIVVWDVDG
jgi:WD40 repeat protein